jgi:hypothetical protein
MKPIRSTLLVLVGLALASGLSSHPVVTGSIAHEHPRFKSVTATYEFDDGTVVVWQAEEDATRPDADKTAYTATIIQTTEKPVTYSLLTLGVQAINHDNIIVSAAADSGNVSFAAPGDLQAQAKPFPVFVPRTGVKADPAAPLQERLDKDRIWFISFSGKVCRLRVNAANRKVFGSTKWATPGGSPGDSHDNNPPVDPPN